MKDIAVLFKPEMICAIDEDRKTQTRRLKSSASVGDRIWIKEPHWMWGKYRWTGKYTKTGKREMSFVDWTDDTHPVLFSLADGGLSYADVACVEYIGYHARSPLFMPKKYARKWLIVTGVREERLQDISVNDALSEGIDHNPMNYPPSEFAWLWDSINADRAPWDSNPVVKVIEFKRILGEK